MTGKEKCKLLKEIRAKIAEANEIPWKTDECTYEGECKGTCPKCEAELRKLECEMEGRRADGKEVVLEGLMLGVIATTRYNDQARFSFGDPLEGEREPIEWKGAEPVELDGQIASPVFADDDWLFDDEITPKPVELDGQIAAPAFDDDDW